MILNFFSVSDSGVLAVEFNCGFPKEKKNWEELNFCPKKQNLEIFIGRYQCDILSYTEMYNTICILVLVALEMTHFSPILLQTKTDKK